MSSIKPGAQSDADWHDSSAAPRRTRAGTHRAGTAGTAEGHAAERGAEQPDVPTDIQAHALGAFFRALAERIEGDPAFAQTMLGAAEHGGTERGGTERGGTERGGTERGGTEQGEIVSEGGAPRARRRIGSDAKPPAAPDRQGGQPPPSRSLHGTRDAAHGTAPEPLLLDPYAVLREDGAAALRVRLGELDLASLRTIVRTHRLDPARLSARWTARERLIDLIAEQVRARAHLGRAFERV